MLKFPFYARLAFILFAIALIIAFMYLGRTVLIPLFFAFLVAILLHPAVRFLEKKGFRRSLASIIILLIFMILFGGIVYFFSHQVVRLTKDMPSLQAKVVGKWNDIQDWINEKYHVSNIQQKDYVSKSANGILGTAVNSAATTFVGILETVVLTIFFFVFTFFILQYRRHLMRFTVELFDRSHNDKVQEVIGRIRLLINNYVLGLLIEMSVVAILIFTSLIIIGVKYALLLCIMTAVMNIIPYLGIYFCMAFAMLITAATSNTGHVVAVGIVFISTHFIDANLILPKIVGGKMKINPFITILVVLIGHLIWGIPGMFLFIPLTAIVRLISEEVTGMEPWAILLGEEKA